MGNALEGCSSGNDRSEGDTDLLIEGGMALTLAEGAKPIPDARVLVSRGRITDIGEKGDVQSPSNTPFEIIDARDAIIMPGLINTHCHAAMTLFRGMADDLPLEQWLFKKVFPAEKRVLSPETVYWGALLGCLEMIASGTTCFVDGYFYQDQTVLAAQASGMRGLIAQGVIDFPAPGIPDPSENIVIARQFIEKWFGFSRLITPGIFCHSPLTCSERTLRDAWELSKEFHLPLQIHLSETIQEVRESVKRFGKRPVHYLDQLGLIDRYLISAHAVHLNDQEVKCLRERGGKVVHVPESNMKLGSGVAGVTRMLIRGVTVGLGTDGCSSNNNLDLFGEMDTAAKLAKVFDQNPMSLPAGEALQMATAGGAAVVGLEKEIGTLEKGKRADIIVVDLKSPHLCPVYDPVSLLVYSASGADVKDVIVDGKVLMKEKEFTTIDPCEVMSKVKESLKKSKGCALGGSVQ